MNSEFAICVHALVYLDHKAACLSSEELAENICTNAARIRKVLGKLKKAEISHWEICAKYLTWNLSKQRGNPAAWIWSAWLRLACRRSWMIFTGR